MLSTRKAVLKLLEREEKSLLELNIGAKTVEQVFKDMKEVYGRISTQAVVTREAIVSILELMAEQGLSKREKNILTKARTSPQPDSVIYIADNEGAPGGIAVG